MDSLSVADIGKSYDGNAALRDVSFHVARGTVLAVCGEGKAALTAIPRVREKMTRWGIAEIKVVPGRNDGFGALELSLASGRKARIDDDFADRGVNPEAAVDAEAARIAGRCFSGDWMFSSTLVNRFDHFAGEACARLLEHPHVEPQPRDLAVDEALRCLGRDGLGNGKLLVHGCLSDTGALRPL